MKTLDSHLQGANTMLR